MKNKNEKVNKDKPQEIYFREDFFSQKEGFFFFYYLWINPYYSTYLNKQIS